MIEQDLKDYKCIDLSIDCRNHQIDKLISWGVADNHPYILELKDDIKRYQEKKNKIYQAVLNIQDETQKEVIKGLYIDCIGIRELSERLNYSQRNIYKIRAKCLETLIDK